MLPSPWPQNARSARSFSPWGPRGSWPRPTCCPDRIAEVSRQVEQVRGRKFERPVPAIRDRHRPRRGACCGQRSRKALPAPIDDYLRSLVVPRADRRLARPARPPRGLLRLAGRRVLRPRAAALLRGQGRRRAGVGRSRPTWPDSRRASSTRTSSPTPSRTRRCSLDDRTQGAQGRQRPRLRAPVPARGRGDARHDQGRAEGDPGRRRASRGGARAAPDRRRPRALERSRGRAGLLRRPALLPLRRGPRRSCAPPIRRGGWAEVDRLWKDPPASSAEILHGCAVSAAGRGTADRQPRGALPGPAPRSTPTRSASGRCASCSGARCSEEEAAEAAAGWRGDRIAFVHRRRGAWAISGASASRTPPRPARFETAFRKARADEAGRPRPRRSSAAAGRS